MAISKMIVQEKTIIKKIPNSEATVQNQIRGIKDSSVASFYLCDENEFKNIKDFFENIDHIYVDGEKIAKYVEDVNTRMIKYKSFYKDEFKLAREKMVLLSNNTELSSIEFDLRQGNRIFIYFKGKTENDYNFTKSIIGGVTEICFVRRQNNIYVYLQLVKNLGVEIFNNKTNVSLNELVDMLDAYVDSYSSISVALRKFGIDFSLAIEKFKFTPEEIIKNSKYSFTPTYAMRIKEGVELSKVLDNITVIESEPNNELNDEDVQLELNPNRQDGGFNKIYYGIPGCGKSYTVDQEIRKVYPDKKRFEKNVFRTTFYLDYSNADFVGQLMPKTDKKGHVTYEPNFGPFTSALQRAFETTDMVYLVIEEINRGNAAAIFGDLFQLMDRLDQEKVELRDDGSKVGDSEYPITNTFIEDYLGIERGKVIIPSNLTIYATMNTSDQNVFPLDTAFKRRWKTQKIIDEYKTSKYHD